MTLPAGDTPSHETWLSLFDVGFSVFPLKPRSKRPKSGWKQYQDARAPRELVESWSRDRSLNIGIVTGAVSGIVVLDLDTPEALAEAERRGLPDSVRVRTPRGYHVYFRHPGTEISNRTGVFRGADVRGDGGYVVGPGSTFVPDQKEAAEGKVAGSYDWVRSPHDVPLADMPAWLMRLIASPAEQVPAKRSTLALISKSGWGNAALLAELDQLARAAEGTRNDALNLAGFRLFQIVAAGHLGGSVVREALTEAGRSLGLELHEIEATLESARAAGFASPRGPKDQSEAASGPEPVAFTEDALADAFAARFGRSWRYVAVWEQWLSWSGKAWLRDQSLHAHDLARQVCREAAIGAPAESLGKRLSKNATISAVEHLARSDRRHACGPEIWDADPWLLNTRDGIVDLRSGEVRPHDPLSYMTKAAGAGLGGGCFSWLEFLDTVTAGDKDLQANLQRVMGYCLTGTTSEHALFFCYGTGANGKSVFVSTMAEVLGDYATLAPMDMFMASHGDRHPTDMAGLRGARMVTSIETEQGSRWAESKLKALTGGDKITARFMRQDFFAYTPQFKLVIVGNHKPAIRNVDEAMRRRLHMIPFTVTIPPEKRDKSLQQRLQAERDGILAWALEGSREWQRIGLSPPASVLAATEDYFDAEDAVGRWLEERCERAPNLKDSSARLFGDWKLWAEQNGEFAGSIRRLSEALAGRGFGRHNTRLSKGFSGLALRSVQPNAGGF
ncbi:MAG: phage/plasmid primase, P4 family [Sphingomonadales bacterium]